MARLVMKYDQDESTKRTFCTPACLLPVIKVTILIGTYFVLSIGLTFFQRWVVQKLRFPLSLVVCQLVIKFILAGICRTVWQCYSRRPAVVVDWNSYLKKVCPAGLASGWDIGLSNWGLVRVTISLYTMTKSTVIIFIMAFSLLFRLEKMSCSLVAIVSMISGGLFLFTYHATQFDGFGFLLILSASFSSGLRWTIAQMVMQKSKLNLTNPIDMVYHVQPWMIVSVLPFAVAIEGKFISSSCRGFRFEDLSDAWFTIWRVLLGATIAYLMEVFEFLVVCETSSLTLSIAGIVKEVFMLVLAVEWEGDQMNFINVIGLMLCLCGITVHVIVRAFNQTKHSNEMRKETSSTDIQMPLLSDHSATKFMGHISSEESADEDVLFNVLQRRSNR